jgi:hypothetical protein
VGLNPSFLFVLDRNLDSADLFSRVGQNEYVRHSADCAQSLRIGASLENLHHSKIGKIEDEYLGFEHDNAPLGIQADSFDL